MTLRYATAEAILARVHGAGAVVQRGQFRGRMKHLRRLGIPLGMTPGRAQWTWYKDRHVYEWAFCLELGEFGLPPEVIVAFMREHWEKEVLPVLTLAASETTGQDDRYFVAQPYLMEKAWNEGRNALDFKFVHTEHPRWPYQAFSFRRAIIINITQLVRDVHALRPLLDERERKRELAADDEGEDQQ